MGRNRRKFTPEFKADALALVEASGGNIAAVAKELGIYDSSLGNWVRQAREQAEGAPSVEERAEIRDLKRELDRGKTPWRSGRPASNSATSPKPSRTWP